MHTYMIKLKIINVENRVIMSLNQIYYNVLLYGLQSIALLHDIC